MKSLKRAMQGAFRSTLTLISPKLNTAVTYRVKFGRKLDLTRPTTFNEKVLWLKFNTYWNNDTVKQCADKLRVRDYLEQHGYGYLLNELIASYEDVDSIDFSTLPDRFAIKLNVGCACNIIVQDKSKLDIEATKNTMRKWLKNNYWLGWSEMQYKDVKPCILIEKYLGGDDGSLPVDYKFYCMNGKATSVMVCEERDGIHHPKFFFMDRKWNKLPYTEEVFKYPDFEIEKPESMDDAFEIAELLAKEFPFVRVDLYIVRNKIYFGELTFTPAAGMDTDFKFRAPGAIKDMPRTKGSKNRITASTDFDAQIAKLQKDKAMLEEGLSKTVSQIEELKTDIKSLREGLKPQKAEIKQAEKEIAKLEAKKAAAEAKAAETAKKVEAEAVLKKLLASGVTADEILEKLK